MVDYAHSLVKSKGDDFIKNIQFEAVDLANDTKRIYDIRYLDDVTGLPKSLELKNWRKLYPETIKDQFVKDLGKAESLDHFEWIFNNVDDAGLKMTTLKSSVMNALRKTDGTPIDELLTLEVDQVSKLTGFVNITEANKATKMLEFLENNENFSKIFHVIE